ncbi:aldehyde dehydrogenase (NAD(P)(+)) ald5 [Apiotrichum porosum]|uniref:Aldehyde dehydrogenase (NAD(P)(+)) ald5 n=1 Tax=Apiotrichum porosum TaxID=105984 RepID=A0A427XQE2_9TREE|nr:aldehyde dehydrogenase (NAD(P)(+)) ald5 [Apiotrichum porosum]RSH81076.1 aldehyde dehydrogenase (NAD(P)(+)) ald5 [Apiotrichum porosum]
MSSKALESTTFRLGNGKDVRIPIGQFINNEFVDSVSGARMDVYNPATGKVIGQVSEGDGADVDVAVKAARAAYEKDNRAWGFMKHYERGVLLNKLADLIEANREELAAIEATDTGKLYTQALNRDIMGVIKTIRYYAGYADKIMGHTYNAIPGVNAYTKLEPMGVCGQVIPWNFPASMWAWKIAPALATGNAVVIKSAENTPLSALKMCEYVREAGFPPGVFNLITGRGPTAGQAIADHMDIDKVAFTGSGPVGRKILEASAKSNLKRVTLELGGKSPNIIFDDVKSVKEAAEWALYGIEMNVGQVCVAGTRILVQDTIAEEFTAEFTKLMSAVKVGDPFDPSTTQGPLVSAPHWDRVNGWVKIACEDGATLALGGKDLREELGGGYYISPTIFTGVKKENRVLANEVFGPVVSIQTFSTEEEAIEEANRTSYGLASAVFSNNYERIQRMNDAIRAGTVWNNIYNFTSFAIPFGGYKESGIGRESGEAVLYNYLETKAVISNMGNIRSPMAPA